MTSFFTLGNPDETLLHSTSASSLLPTPPSPHIFHSYHLPPPAQSLTTPQVRRPYRTPDTTVFTPCTPSRSSAGRLLQPEPSTPQRLFHMSLSNPALNRPDSPIASTPRSSLDSDSSSNATSAKVETGKGVLETYSLFPTATAAFPPRPSPSTVSPDLANTHEPELKAIQSKHDKGNQNEDFNGSPSTPAKTGNGSNQNKYSSQPPSAPPTRPLPLLPPNIPPRSIKAKPRDLQIKTNEDTNALCPMPEPPSAIHPAFRRSLSSPTSDTGSIPIFLQLPKLELEIENALQHNGTFSPPTDLKPVSQLTSLLLTRQELEEKLRRLEAILGRYGVSEISRRSFLLDVEGESTLPPPYQSPSTTTSIGRSATTPPLLASKTASTTVSSAEGKISPASGSINSPDGRPTTDVPRSAEEKKKGRKRDMMRSWPSHSKEQEQQSPNSSRGNEKQKEKETGKEREKERAKEKEREKEKKKDEDSNQSSYATRPTYGKNLEKIFGAKPFEVANAIHLSISRPTSRSGPSPSLSHSHSHSHNPSSSILGSSIAVGTAIGSSIGIGGLSGKILFRRSAEPLPPNTTANLFTPLPMPAPVPEKRRSIRRKRESKDRDGGAVEIDTHCLDGAARVDTTDPAPVLRHSTTTKRRDSDASKHSPAGVSASAQPPSLSTTTTSTRYLTRTGTSASTADQKTQLQTPIQYEELMTSPPPAPRKSTPVASRTSNSTSSPAAPPTQEKETPSHKTTLSTLRSEYQETALHLAEVDLEIELACLRGDMERVRRRRIIDDEYEALFGGEGVGVF